MCFQLNLIGIFIVEYFVLLISAAHLQWTTEIKSSGLSIAFLHWRGSKYPLPHLSFRISLSLTFDLSSQSQSLPASLYADHSPRSLWRSLLLTISISGDDLSCKSQSLPTSLSSPISPRRSLSLPGDLFPPDLFLQPKESGVG